MTATLSTSAVGATIRHVDVGAFRIATDAPESERAWEGARACGIAVRVGPVAITNGPFANRPHWVNGLVRRWSATSDDEGAFVICSFWLADCLARAGELGRAREVFERVVSHANDVGLLAEEIDPRDGSLLGNFPQAFSHVGLITAAWAIDQAAEHQREATP